MDFVIMGVLGLFLLFILFGIGWIISWIIAKSKGKIEIVLDKFEFVPGEAVTGKVILKLKKPVEANSLNVGIVGERKIQHFSGSNYSSRKQVIFDFKKPLSGKGVYSGEHEIPFQILIPRNIFENQIFSGIAGKMVNSAMFLTGNYTKVDWYVRANLDIPGVDIKKSVRINIS